MKYLLLLSVPICLAACSSRNDKAEKVRSLTLSQAAPALHPEGMTIATRFTPPHGYHRAQIAPTSFGAYLRQVPLKPDGAVVHYFDGREKPNEGIYAAVVDFEIGNKDLQQCADAVMRLRAEYLFSAGKKDQIHFHLTNGFDADYSHWRRGYRPAFSGQKVNWISKAAPDESRISFRHYLDFVFAYAGTLSLSKELLPVPYRQMQAGDVLIVGGSPGHAVTVMDMAEDEAGHKLYLLAQSYMPAQDIQVLQNPVSPGISPWYALDVSGSVILTPQWRFTTGNLMRFRD